MAQNRIEKIAQRFMVTEEKKEVHSGDYILIKPAHVLTHDNTGAVIPKFLKIGAKKIANPRQPVFALDHNVQDKSKKNLAKYKKIEEFAAELGVDFYPAGRGIGHQIMCEEGYAWPGTLAVASDSHANMYGGLGCLGTPVVRTDAAALWATGQTWWQVPPVARVHLSGKLPTGVTGKDVIITLCGFFDHDEALNHALEFTGEGLLSLSLEQRLTIANMTTEWGALAGLFPIDKITLDWLKKRARTIKERGLAGVPSDTDGKGERPRFNERRISELEDQLPDLLPDAGAFYAKEITLDLGSVQPFVAGPDSVKVMMPVSDAKKKNIKIQKAYLVSCVNSRVEDLAQAAEIVRGKEVAENVEFYLAAASSEVQQQSEVRGDWQTLLNAGAIPLPPGCGPCIGLGAGLLKDGEVGISATNRNFKGRMGSKNASAYLASPAVVAASAIAGKIDYPGACQSGPPRGSCKVNRKSFKIEEEVKILPGFSPKISGELVFCYQDNLNTDGIFPGKYTYRDDFTPSQQAGVVMENYDPDFNNLIRKGDILVAGFNFGTGSSREQAATALKYRGIGLVVAGSFSETYKRNALNNGFLVIEAPGLVKKLKGKFGEEKLTVRTGVQAEIDFRTSRLSANGEVYPIRPLGEAAQQLIVEDGLENWVKRRLKD